MSDPFAPISGGRPSAYAPPEDKIWRIVLPVPKGTMLPPLEHPKLGKPSSLWRYADATGALLGFILRFDREAGKEFRPLAFYRSTTTGGVAWRWESWPAPRPLFGLDRLAARPDAPVIVCEGEKAADAAQRLLPDYVAVTWPGGAKSAAKADWMPLRGRQVILSPDNDLPGQAAMKTAGELCWEAGAASVAIIHPPAGAEEGWDLADAEIDGWTQSRTREFIASALPVAPPPVKEKRKGKNPKERRPRQRESMAPLVAGLQLWCGLDREAYIAIPTEAGAIVNWPINSSIFKDWLSGRVFDELGFAPSAQAIEDICRTLRARANKEGAKRAPWLRVGRRDERLYIDLCDDLGRVVEICANGCEIIENRDLPFVRSEHMAPFCEPEFGYGMEEFRGFVNASDDDFVLLVGWMLGAFRGCGPYPILVINGEHGSGKSALSFLVRSLVDPNFVKTQSPPKDERDLIIAAMSWFLLFLENVSHLSAEMSDAYSRVSTGGGLALRALHTNRELMVFSGARPIAFNGIELSGVRADFSDRTINIYLRAIPDKERRTMKALERDWEVARPRVLGALFTALSAALRNEKNVRLSTHTRMADFEEWIVAAEPGLGWEPGTFLRAYRDNRLDTAGAAFDADPIAGPVRDFMKKEGLQYWEGTATDLLGRLDLIVSESRRQQRSWPKSGQALGGMIVRSAPLLREKDIIVEKRHSGDRKIVLARGEASE